MNADEGRTVYIEPVPPNFTHAEVSQVFESVGKIVEISTPKFYDKDTDPGTNKGFGFVTYETIEAATEALKKWAWVQSTWKLAVEKPRQLSGFLKAFEDRMQGSMPSPAATDVTWRCLSKLAWREKTQKYADMRDKLMRVARRAKINVVSKPESVVKAEGWKFDWDQIHQRVFPEQPERNTKIKFDDEEIGNEQTWLDVSTQAQLRHLRSAKKQQLYELFQPYRKEHPLYGQPFSEKEEWEQSGNVGKPKRARKRQRATTEPKSGVKGDTSEESDTTPMDIDKTTQTAQTAGMPDPIPKPKTENTQQPKEPNTTPQTQQPQAQETTTTSPMSTTTPQNITETTNTNKIQESTQSPNSTETEQIKSLGGNPPQSPKSTQSPNSTEFPRPSESEGIVKERIKEKAEDTLQPFEQQTEGKVEGTVDATQPAEGGKVEEGTPLDPRQPEASNGKPSVLLNLVIDHFELPKSHEDTAAAAGRQESDRNWSEPIYIRFHDSKMAKRAVDLIVGLSKADKAYVLQGEEEMQYWQKYNEEQRAKRLKEKERHSEITDKMKKHAGSIKERKKRKQDAIQAEVEKIKEEEKTKTNEKENEQSDTATKEQEPPAKQQKLEFGSSLQTKIPEHKLKRIGGLGASTRIVFSDSDDD